MQKLLKLGHRLLKEERAAEVTELGIVLALIVALAIPVIFTIGQKILDAYNTTQGALDAAH